MAKLLLANEANCGEISSGIQLCAKHTRFAANGQLAAPQQSSLAERRKES